MTTPLPSYETLLTEALKNLAVDSGVVSFPVQAGASFFQDNTKNWATNVHRNRLIKIVRGRGAGRLVTISGNTPTGVTINGNWPVGLDTTSVYVVFEIDIAQVIRDTLSGGVDIDISAKIDEIIAALAIGLEASVDSGIATGGSNTTLEDTNKNWALGMWGGVGDSLLQVTIGGINYLRFTALPVNTATVITIGALPGGIAVAAGCPYSIKRSLNPLLPLERALLHNVVGYLAAADILGADLAPLNTPCLFRITACFNAAGILSVETTNAAGGGGAVVQQFNGGVALNNNSLYMFEHLVHAGDTINYQYSVGATIMTFRVQEIIGATS